MLDLSSRKVYGALAEQCVGGDAKADKVETAVAGHLAGLDSNGNLTDSGVSPTEDVTVEGNPVTFDSPFEQDAKSVVVSVKPIQDLHGYDAPWVGGAGKNKLPLVLADIKAINTSGTWTGNTYTKDGMSYTILVDDGDNVVGIRVNGETSVNTSLNLPLFSLPTGTYIVSVGALRSRLNKNGSQIADISANQSYTLTVDSNSDEFILYLYPGATTISNVTVYPMIRLSTESDATFAPYSNICPISGTDEVEIEVSDGESEPTTTTIPLPSTLYDADVDVTEGDADSRFDKVVFDGSVDENISLISSNAGSRYAIAIPDDSVTWTAEGELSNMLSSNEFAETTNYDTYAGGIGIHYRTNGSHAVVCGMGVSDINTVELFRAYLAEHPLQICYELATPTTISFTPADIELLEGTNVVSTNGEKVAVTYGRSLWQDIDDLKTDTEGKLDKSDVATIEGDTASKAYSVNDFMLRADGFYRVTAPIAQNASITSSNTTKTTIGAVLTALLNA